MRKSPEQRNNRDLILLLNICSAILHFLHNLYDYFTTSVLKFVYVLDTELCRHGIKLQNETVKFLAKALPEFWYRHEVMHPSLALSSLALSTDT